MATIEKVRDALTAHPLEAGQTDVRTLRVRLGEDSNGDEAIFVRLILSDPPAGHETWPVEDLRALRRAIRIVLTEIDPEAQIPWVISFEPETGDDFGAEDIEGQVQIDL